MSKITPFLWFNDQAEEAVAFYTGIFKNSKRGRVTRFTEAGPGKPGTTMVAEFELDGQPFLALNGGPAHTFSVAISFVVNCETQAEIDEFWEKLSAGGEPGRCGWLTDKFGVSWQVVPKKLPELIQNSEQADRVMRAILGMDKLDLPALERAAAGR